MASRHRILILDDEQAFLELCQELLVTLPSQPEIRTASSGAHAMALLASEPFSLLMTDLKMPGMDGFQVLTIVRRKFPTLRTMVMTSAVDEQFRNRAYALGIDLYLEKPKSAQEIKLFIECIESMLEREAQGGFRGVQSKTLLDLIQIECSSQASCVLKISNGPVEAKIWIQNGELIDATLGDLAGEDAFKRVLGWKSGNFETLPAEPDRPRTIHASYQGLLLDSAQTLDEVAAGERSGEPGAAPAQTGTTVSPLAPLARFKGVEFVVQLDSADPKKLEHYGAENPEQVAAWTRQTLQSFGALGDKLHAGQLARLEGVGTQRHLAVAVQGDKILCGGFRNSLNLDEVRDTLKQMLATWVS